jgi:hypothetical protein
MCPPVLNGMLSGAGGAAVRGRIGRGNRCGAWGFERINRRYARHLKILGKRPDGALRNDAAEKSLLRWSAEVV